MFLVSSIQKFCKNPKPVVFYSIRVWLCFYNLKYNKNIVIAGILHDVIEDANVKLKKLKPYLVVI